MISRFIHHDFSVTLVVDAHELAIIKEALRRVSDICDADFLENRFAQEAESVLNTGAFDIVEKF